MFHYMGRKRVIHYTCKCGKPTRSINSGYCKDCHNAYQRSNRKKHSELTPEQRNKANARSYVNVYIKRGLVVKKPCQCCGEPKAQAHHIDYSKPLEVVWLCRRCHLKEHSIELCEVLPTELNRVRNRKGSFKT